MPLAANQLYEFGPYRIDPARNLLLRNAQPVPLTSKAFETLLVLVELHDQVVSKDELMKRVWPDTFVEESNLTQHISMVRKALGETSQDRHYILTLSGRGYRFAEKIRVISENGTSLALDPHPAPAPEAGSGSSRTVILPLPARISPESSGPDLPIAPTAAGIVEKRWSRVAAVLATILIAAGITGYGIYQWRSHSSRSPDIESLRITKLTSSGKAEDVAISPDGSYVVYSQRDRQGVGLWLHHIATGSETQIVPSEDVDFRGLTFSPDGNSVYFVRTRKEIGGFKDLYAIPVLGGRARLLTRDIDLTRPVFCTKWNVSVTPR